MMEAVNPLKKEEIMSWAAWNVREKDAGPASEDPGIPEKGDGDENEQSFDFPLKEGLPAHVHEHMRKVLDHWRLEKRHMLLEAMYTAQSFRGGVLGLLC
jgi:hypothetical protein